MGRLTPEQWDQARADYEVRGTSFTELAKNYGVDRAAVSRRAKKEGWIQGKSHALVEKKVNAIKMLAEVSAESHAMPVTFQYTLEKVVNERLQAEGCLASLDVALALKGAELVSRAKTPEDFELLARGRKHLAPPTSKEGTTVNVNQQQASVQQPLSPAQVLRALARNNDEHGNSE